MLSSSNISFFSFQFHSQHHRTFSMEKSKEEMMTTFTDLLSSQLNLSEFFALKNHPAIPFWNFIFTYFYCLSFKHAGFLCKLCFRQKNNNNFWAFKYPTIHETKTFNESSHISTIHVPHYVGRLRKPKEYLVNNGISYIMPEKREEKKCEKKRTAVLVSTRVNSRT